MRRIPIAVAAVALALTVAGCDSVQITWVDEGASYTQASATALLDELQPGKLADQPTAKSQELRSEALGGLRGEGESASDAATLITDTLPEDSGSVPFYVERARFDGSDAVLVVEAVGPAGGTLVDKRLWVLSEEGDLLYSANR